MAKVMVKVPDTQVQKAMKKLEEKFNKLVGDIDKLVDAKNRANTAYDQAMLQIDERLDHIHTTIQNYINPNY